jgi:trigger factor
VEKNINYSTSGINTLELTLTKAEVNARFDIAYNELQKNVNIQGFRKGKVPLPMLKKLYGKAVEAETNVDIVNEYFPKIAQEENLMLIANPILKNVEKIDDNYKYTIEFQTVPQFEVKDYKDITIYEPVHVVTSEEVDRELDQIALEFAEYEDVDSVESLDCLVNVGVEPVHEHEEHEEHDHDHHHHEHQSIYLRDEKYLIDFRDLFLNRKVGDVFTYHNPERADEPEMKIVIESIQRVTPPAIDNELAKKYSKDEFDSIDDLRKDLEFKIQDYWDEKARQEMENQMMDIITKNNSHIVVPEPLIENALDILVENLKKQYGLKKEDKQLDPILRTNYRKTAENFARWDMIRNEIMKIEDIKLEDYDIDDFIETNKHHLPEASVEQLKEIINSNEQVLDKIKSKKLFDLLLGYATTEEISFDDFYKKRQMEAEQENAPKIQAEEYNPLENDEDSEEINEDDADSEK